MITVIHLTELTGRPIAVAFPADSPFVIRSLPANERGPAQTMITFGAVWARVKESPEEILALLKGEEMP